MNSFHIHQSPVSKLFQEYEFKKKKKGKKRKNECCEKYLKKKGKYCNSCPIVYVICKNAGRDF
ncbi:MAG: hypothetical protein AAF600_04570 [Bacteroidota bacterium]